MPYYHTIEEDIARAKEILERGKVGIDGLDAIYLSPATQDRMKQAVGGNIYGADTYAAYKLLESFVEELEKRQTTITRYASTHGPMCDCPLCREVRRGV